MTGDEFVAHVQSARAQTLALWHDARNRLTSGALHVVRMRGALRGRIEASAVVATERAGLDIVNTWLFDGLAEIDDFGPASSGPLREQTRARATDGDDLLVYDTWPWMVSRGERIVLSPWVDASSSPGADLDRYLQIHVSENVRRTLKKAAQMGFRVEQSTRDDDLDAFHERMYAPFTSARFGKGARVARLADLLAWRGRTSNVELVLLTREGRKVAGAALVHSKPLSEVKVWGYGATPDIYEDDKLRSAFMALLNREVFRIACARTLRVNLGLTRPFLDDGVLHYKRQWGCRFVPAAGMSRFVLEPRDGAPPSLAEALPLLALGRGELIATSIGVRDRATTA